MKRYAISWYDEFTMNLKMSIVDEENEFEALKVAFHMLIPNPSTKHMTEAKDIPTLKALARSYEGAIGAIEIFEPDHVYATDVIKRFIKGASNAIPSKGLPQYAH